MLCYTVLGRDAQLQAPMISGFNVCYGAYFSMFRAPRGGSGLDVSLVGGFSFRARAGRLRVFLRGGVCLGERWRCRLSSCLGLDLPFFMGLDLGNV